MIAVIWAWITGRGLALVLGGVLVAAVIVILYGVHHMGVSEGRAECAAGLAKANADVVSQLRDAAVSEHDADVMGAQRVAEVQARVNELHRELERERAAHSETMEQCRAHLPEIGGTSDAN